jgi:hypothetical protein
MTKDHYKVFEKLLMAFLIVLCLSSAMVSYSLGQSWIWQIVSIVWIANAWMKQNEINELENK